MHALQANQITDNLPLLGDLDKTIRSALPVKIATPHGLYTKWLGKMTLANPELMAKIFEINDVTPCMDLLIRFGGQIVDPPRAGNSEMSYVSRWDGPIRCVLDTVLPDGKSDRDSCQLTSTVLCRPDYLFILDSVCVFRGEEKARGVPIEVPRRELTDKLIWTYGDVPYLFAYAAAGDTLSLYAISRTSDSQVGAKHLATFNLEDVEERLRLLLATLNISLLLRSLAKLCPDSGRDEYRMFTRPGGVVIYLEPFRVIKAFQDRHLFDEAQRRATRVYSILRQHDVPNADRMSFADPSAKRLVFAPCGQEKKPTNLAELFQALRDVLEALIRLHALSWMHRDIRCWSNVMRQRVDTLSRSSWFMIDFMDAEQSPQNAPSGQHLNREEHAPDIFDKPSHTTAVDIWSVGRLISTSGDEVLGCWCDTGGERDVFLQRLLNDDPSERPSATEALEELRTLEESFRKRQKRSKRRKRQQ